MYTMQGHLEKEGQYELFETTNGHQILALNNKNYFAIVKGKYGDILVKSDSDHQKKKTQKKGHFYLASFDDDPDFRDLPHLFLEEGDKFREWILPNNAPTEKDYKKKLIKTQDLLSREKVESHVKGSGQRSNEKHDDSPTRHARADKNHKSSDYKRKTRASSERGERSKADLYQEARKAGIEGRSNMNKEELENALKKNK